MNLLQSCNYNFSTCATLKPHKRKSLRKAEGFSLLFTDKTYFLVESVVVVVVVVESVI